MTASLTRRPSIRKADGFFRLLARGLALFLAIYVLLSIFMLLKDHTYNLNTWWIDLHFLPTFVGIALQGILAVALVIFAIFSPSKFALKLALGIIFLLFAVYAVINAVDVLMMAADGTIRLGFPVPFSLFIALAFLLLAVGAISKRAAQDDSSQDADGQKRSGGGIAKTILVMLLAVVIAGALFPLGQVYCFGKTEYHMQVDAVVVLGAQVLPDHTPSYALQDRLDKAISLYVEKITPVLIMSGGIDIGGTDEAAAMKEYAIAAGVPADAIIIDNKGNTTELSAQNTIEIAEDHGFETLGAVSSYYHMARIKMLFLANGHDVYTCPATPVKEGSNLPFNTVREIPGWWYYWFGAVFA